MYIRNVININYMYQSCGLLKIKIVPDWPVSYFAQFQFNLNIVFFSHEEKAHHLPIDSFIERCSRELFIHDKDIPERQFTY